MTDYIKGPTLPTQDLLRGVAAISPSSRINSQQRRPEGYPGHPADPEEQKDSYDSRHFLRLRSLIRELQGSTQINRVDFATADAELHRLGLAIVEQMLIPQLMQLKIPLESIEQLLRQLDRGACSVSHGPADRINRAESPLFPVSTEGLAEYNLNIAELQIHPGKSGSNIVDEIKQMGFCIKQQNRLRLTFGRFGSLVGVEKEPLNLKISVLLGVLESDEAERRAILYPQTDKCYGLYADKRINLLI